MTTYEKEPRCGNCKFQDGCKGYIDDYGYCDEWVWEGEDDLTEDEKKGILGDYLYQRYKEDIDEDYL